MSQNLISCVIFTLTDPAQHSLHAYVKMFLSWTRLISVSTERTTPTRFTQLTVEQVTSSVRLNRLRYICVVASGVVQSWRECIETIFTSLYALLTKTLEMHSQRIMRGKMEAINH